MGTAGGPLRGARAPHSRYGCAHCRHRAGPWPDAGYQEHNGLSGVREIAPKSLDVATGAFSPRATRRVLRKVEWQPKRRKLPAESHVLGQFWDSQLVILRDIK